MSSMLPKDDLDTQTSDEELSPSPSNASQRERYQAARQLLREWLADTSGYDEEAWPKVKKILEENRLSPRSRFSD